MRLTTSSTVIAPIGPIVRIDDRDAAQIILIEQIENFLFVCVRVHGDDGLETQFVHALLGICDHQASDRNRAGERAVVVDEDDVVELVGDDFVEADVIDHFAARGVFADNDQFGIHHAASRFLVITHQGFDFGFLLSFHFLHHFFGGVGREAGNQVGGFVGIHFFENIGGFFGVEFFDHLRLQALVEFGDGFGRGVLGQRIDDALALGGRKLFHDFGEVGRVEFGELLAGHAQLHAAQRVRLDQVDELPADRARGKSLFEAADGHGRDDSLEQAAHGAFYSHIHLGDAHLDVSVGALLGEVNIVDADDFAAIGVDDLLVEEVFADSQPGLIGVEELEGGLVGGEVHAAGSDRCDLVVTGDNRAILAATQQQTGDAIGLVGGLDEHLFDAADEVAGRIEGLGAENFSGVKHVDSLRAVTAANQGGEGLPGCVRAKKKPGPA